MRLLLQALCHGLYVVVGRKEIQIKPLKNETDKKMQNRVTSERHTNLLDDYQKGESIFQAWVQENLGEISLMEWEWGRVSLYWEMDDRFIMPDGVMFGGHIASVSDHFVALGAMTVLTDSKERFRTSRLETNFFRPLTKPHANIEVKVTNASKNLIHVEAEIFNAHDKLAARIHAVQMRRLTG